MNRFVVRQKTWVIAGITIILACIDLMFVYIILKSEISFSNILLLLFVVIVTLFVVYCFAHPRLVVKKQNITVYRALNKKREYTFGNIQSVKCTQSLAENGEVIWLTFFDGNKLSVPHYRHNYQKFRKDLLQKKTIEWI